MWAAASAEVGLVDLHPQETANGALLHPDFQNLHDPFDIRKVIVSIIYCDEEKEGLCNLYK